MRIGRVCNAFVCLVAMLVAAQGARADGLIVIQQPAVVRPPAPAPVPPPRFAFAPLEVTYHRVNVEIHDQVATTSVDQEFYNPNNARLEGTYLFPLPDGAHVDRFAMDVNGRMTEAELLDADKARGIYEDIVRKYRDPALLEYVGRGALKARVFPIEPNSKKQIKITYTQLLKSDSGLVEYTYPLNTEKFSAAPLKDVSVRVTIACADPIKSVYSPSHKAEVRRDGERTATIGYEEKNARPDADFKVLFSRAKADVGVDLLTYRNSPDDGYFLLLASPGFGASARDQVQQRDVCFVIDTSGSMAEAGGKKMEQAKKALSFCLQNLNPGDRFDVIRFSTEAEGLFNELKPAEKANLDKAQAFVQALKPIGGTAIEDALKKALALRGTGDPHVSSSSNSEKDHGRVAHATDRPYVIIFLTDGQPTIGETSEDKLVESVAKANVANTRVFSFGIGTDVNTHLLDRVASQTKAVSQYVLPEEDLEVKLSSFYSKIKEPVLSNVEIAFTGNNIRTSQLYPSAMPDLFKGEVLVAFGRYSGTGPAAVKVSGTLNGQRREFTTDVKFADHDTANAYIPRLWATRRVGWLLDEIRLHGESAELKEEATRLAREHGIVTPYTAYLIMEDERGRNVPIAMRNFRQLEEDAAGRQLVRERYERAAAEAQQPAQRSGAGAVATARDLSSLKLNDNLDGVARKPGAAGMPGGAVANAGMSVNTPAAGPQEPAAAPTQVVNGRAFYANAGVWTDSTAQARKDLKRVEVAFGSDDYFALLQKHPEAAQWLALGNQVDVVLGDTLYVVR
jgi:Ca-activated chloride channel family protein